MLEKARCREILDATRIGPTAYLCDLGRMSLLPTCIHKLSSYTADRCTEIPTLDWTIGHCEQGLEHLRDLRWYSDCQLCRKGINTARESYITVQHGSSTPKGES
jgi:hypothetical protein